MYPKRDSRLSSLFPGLWTSDTNFLGSQIPYKSSDLPRAPEVLEVGGGAKGKTSERGSSSLPVDTVNMHIDEQASWASEHKYMY